MDRRGADAEPGGPRRLPSCLKTLSLQNSIRREKGREKAFPSNAILPRAQGPKKARSWSATTNWGLATPAIHLTQRLRSPKKKRTPANDKAPRPHAGSTEASQEYAEENLVPKNEWEEREKMAPNDNSLHSAGPVSYTGSRSKRLNRILISKKSVAMGKRRRPPPGC